MSAFRATQTAHIPGVGGAGIDGVPLASCGGVADDFRSDWHWSELGELVERSEARGSNLKVQA